MPQPIRVLSDDLASQIAAGEVVERPASVVKELIENALDARATRVDVSIEGGGITLIEVADDGHGMSLVDAPLCLGRHATSKLQAFDQLETLKSYGFRGEALPSIASVSRLSLRTRSADSDSGTLLEAEGTTAPRQSPVGSPVGTTLTVRDLFYNVPARRKFLRSSNTESGHVSEVLVDAALSRPEVSFTLTRDKRRTKNFPRVPSRKLRVEQVLAGEDLAPCLGERGPLSVEGYLSSPARGRQGALGLKIFVNGRPVRDRALCATIAHAYGGALEKGRYPRGVVYLTLPGRLVDVNVHPQKTEVRFAEPRAVCDAVYSVVSREMARGPFAAMMKSASRGEEPRPAPPPPAKASASPARILHDGAPPVSGSRYAPARLKPSREPVRPQVRVKPIETQAPRVSRTGATWKGLRLIGVARTRYLVCEGEEGVVILDQHAAHERVLLSDLRRDFSAGKVPSQALLFPETVGLSPQEVLLAEKWGAVLGRLGLDVRVRSEKSASIHSSPRLLSRTTPQQLLVQLLSDLGGLADTEEADLDPILARLACAEAIQPGDRVQRDMAESLLRSLVGVDFDVSCPHGRVILSLTSDGDLERKAGRA